MDKKLEKWVTFKECDSKNFEISILEMPDLTKLTKNLKIEPVTKINKLRKIDKSKIKDLILKNIYELSSKQKNSVLEKFSFSDKDKYTKIRSKIKNASLYIATNGKIGEATNMIISKENYERFNISNFEGKFDILFENVNDIYLYRKNSSEQPGLVLFYHTDENNQDYYSIESIGFYPERQYIKIIIK